MKKLISSIKIFLLCVLFTGTLHAEEPFINVYGWTNYIAPEVIVKFQKETGIRVNYNIFESNEALFTKLKSSPTADYDVIMPSSYTVEKMIHANMLTPLNKSKLPNLKHLNPALLNKSYDPQNNYSVPYFWGTVGIMVNDKYFDPTTIKTWQDLWQPRFRDRLVLANDMRDIFAVAFKVLGYSANDKDAAHIEQAYHKLNELMPNILTFVSDSSKQIYVNEDAVVGILESGDAVAIMRENSHIHYIVPQGGTILFSDNLAIPKDAKHIESAHKFINFLMRPEIAKMNSLHTGYASPNLGAVQLMSKKMRQNNILNPVIPDLKYADMQGYIGEQANRVYLRYWHRLKLGA